MLPVFSPLAPVPTPEAVKPSPPDRPRNPGQPSFADLMRARAALQAGSSRAAPPALATPNDVVTTTVSEADAAVDGTPSTRTPAAAGAATPAQAEREVARAAREPGDGEAAPAAEGEPGEAAARTPDDSTDETTTSTTAAGVLPWQPEALRQAARGGRAAAERRVDAADERAAAADAAHEARDAADALRRGQAVEAGGRDDARTARTAGAMRAGDGADAGRAVQAAEAAALEPHAVTADNALLPIAAPDATVAVAPPAAPPITTPAPAAVAAAAPTATVPVPVESPAFAAALGVQVSVLAKDGIENAELQLNPAELGPVSVRIALDGRAARVDLGADVHATRQILEGGLPQLAAALSEAGFTLAGGGVGARQGRDGDTGRDDGGKRRIPSRDDGVTATGTAPPRRMTATLRDGSIDLYA